MCLTTALIDWLIELICRQLRSLHLSTIQWSTLCRAFSMWTEPFTSGSQFIVIRNLLVVILFVSTWLLFSSYEINIFRLKVRLLVALVLYHECIDFISDVTIIISGRCLCTLAVSSWKSKQKGLSIQRLQFCELLHQSIFIV